MCNHFWKIEPENGNIWLKAVCRYCGKNKKLLSSKGLQSELDKGYMRNVKAALAIKASYCVVPTIAEVEDEMSVTG